MLSNPELLKLNEIAIKVGQLEVLQINNARSIGDMASSVNRLVDKWDKSDDIAREADQRARSAHHRIEETNKHYDGEVRTINARLDKEVKEIKDGQKWLIGTTFTVVGLFMTAVGLLWKVVTG